MSSIVILGVVLALFAALLFLLLTAGELRCRQVMEARAAYRVRHKMAGRLLADIRQQFLEEEQRAAAELRQQRVEIALNPPPEPVEDGVPTITPAAIDAVVEEISHIADEDPASIARAVQILIRERKEGALVAAA